MRVLIIGSLAGELGQAARLAIARGARLDQADGIDAALARLRLDARVDLVLCELPNDIAALVRALAAERMHVPVVACGTGNDPDEAVRAIRAGAREFLPLPPDPDLIAAILEAASGETHALIVRDPAMAATVRRAEQVAGAEASVLITGESGTGKEVLARHIHRRSRRAGGPFVALNCAAIPENLLESELFGHEKGAFSGAVARRVGKFEAADGGTLLLDEISEMDIRLQAKLLRALQEREIDRLGGASAVRVNVRILATTNRDLPVEVARGSFREDLYFRLNVVSLRVPPLRERPGDVAALAEYFARRYAEVNGVAYRKLSPAAVAAARRAWLARQCPGAGEHHPSGRVARRGRGHRADRDRACPARIARRDGSAGRAWRGDVAPRGRRRTGGTAHGRCRARSDHRDAGSYPGQPDPRGDHPRHFHPGAAQQAARLCHPGRRGAAASRRRRGLAPCARHSAWRC